MRNIVIIIAWFAFDWNITNNMNGTRDFPEGVDYEKKFLV